jgi:hypothetical protein
MHSISNLIRISVMAGLALLAAACTQSGEEDASSPNRILTAPSDPGMSLEMETAPQPIASLALPNGNQVEFYDFESSTLIVESGAAGVPSGLPKDINESFREKNFASPGDRLFAVWNQLAPAAPIPEGLKAFHLRWKDRPADALTRVRPRVSLDISGPNLLGPGELNAPMAKQAAPDGCNNGCCDFAWLSTFGECHADWNVNWFFFNSKANVANVPDVEQMVSMVCAATGTSRWNFHIGDSKASWNIAQANYRKFSWSAGWFDQDLSSSVNSLAAPRLHTHCGDVRR